MRALHRFDKSVSAYVQQLPPSLMQLMSAVSFLGEPATVMLIGFVGYLSATAGHHPKIQRAFVYAAAAFLLSTILKLSLKRARPHDLDIRTLGIRSYSFPSGHAFGTVIIYGLFSYIDYIRFSAPWNFISGALVWMLIAVVGISRVYLKAHFPSDVVGGWLLGLISLVVIVATVF